MWQVLRLRIGWEYSGLVQMLLLENLMQIILILVLYIFYYEMEA